MKVQPEDFVVEESLVELDVSTQPAKGLLPLYRVEKQMIDTPHLERELSAALKSRVSFAGMKDKRAVAVQFATPTSARARAPGVVEGGGFRAECVGYVRRPLGRGMIRGNRFRVTLRDCSPAVIVAAEAVFELAGRLRVPNYYGLQRFGGSGALTHRVGREIVARRFEEAVRVILCEPRSSDDEATLEAREAISKGRYSAGAALLPKGQDIERMIARRLAEKPDDFIGALRAVPIRLRRLYTEAHQSYLFNRTLSLALERGLNIASTEQGDNWGEATEDGMVLKTVHGVKEPLIGGAVPLVQLVGYAYRNYGSRFDMCSGEAMEEEGVTPRNFFIDEMQEASVEGGFRRPYMVVRNPSANPEEEKAVLAFTLSRGEYATVLVREIVKPEDPVRQGFA
jgi:tRNA pseudouridine13 synthase